MDDGRNCRSARASTSIISILCARPFLFNCLCLDLHANHKWVITRYERIAFHSRPQSLPRPRPSHCPRPSSPHFNRANSAIRPGLADRTDLLADGLREVRHRLHRARKVRADACQRVPPPDDGLLLRRVVQLLVVVVARPAMRAGERRDRRVAR